MPRQKKSNEHVNYSSSSESVCRDIAGNIQYVGTTADLGGKSLRQNNPNTQVNGNAVHMFDKLPEPEQNSEEGKSYTLGEFDTDTEQVNASPFPRAINKLKKVFLEQKPDMEVQLDVNDFKPVGVPWSYSLLGYVVGKFPGKQALLQSCNQWGVKFRYAPHPSKWLVFTFKNKNDMKMVLENGPYFVYNRPLIIKPLPPLFDFANEELHYVPVWVKIRNLPLDLWSSTALSKILSLIGNPIRMDHQTAACSAISYARALVNINVSKVLVNEIRVRLPENKLLNLELDFENVPYFCQRCLLIGHRTANCGVKKSAMNSNKKQGKSVAAMYRAKKPKDLNSHNIPVRHHAEKINPAGPSSPLHVKHIDIAATVEDMHLKDTVAEHSTTAGNPLNVPILTKFAAKGKNDESVMDKPSSSNQVHANCSVKEQIQAENSLFGSQELMGTVASENLNSICNLRTTVASDSMHKKSVTSENAEHVSAMDKSKGSIQQLFHDTANDKEKTECRSKPENYSKVPEKSNGMHIAVNIAEEVLHDYQQTVSIKGNSNTAKTNVEDALQNNSEAMKEKGRFKHVLPACAATVFAGKSITDQEAKLQNNIGIIKAKDRTMKSSKGDVPNRKENQNCRNQFCDTYCVQQSEAALDGLAFLFCDDATDKEKRNCRNQFHVKPSAKQIIQVHGAKHVLPACKDVPNEDCNCAEHEEFISAKSRTKTTKSKTGQRSSKARQKSENYLHSKRKKNGQFKK